MQIEQVNKGRWGFYVCDYETYQKLRRLNHLCELNKRVAAKKRRRDAKQVHHQFGWEKQGRGGCVFYTPEHGYNPPTPNDLLSEMESQIQETYRAAKKPYPSPEAVPTCPITYGQIDAFLREGEEWHKANT